MTEAGRRPRPERELVAALRAELAAVDPGRRCDRSAERAGLGHAPRPGDQPVARLVHRLSVDAGDDASSPAFAWDRAADHCRIAYLRGRFLAHGSLSLASGRTHLEFVVPADEAPELARQLASLGLPASRRIRRGRGVVTWKSVEVVGTFLRLIGAGAALLELEARQVSRALRGDLNRVINAESANLQRAVAAAGRQLAAIDQLETEGVLSSQPYVVRLVAEGRRETPEATLSELAERLELHRSAVQRALERVEWLALHGAPSDGPVPRGRTDRGRRAPRGLHRSRTATGDPRAPLA
jgi:WhiA LAGLIDADG-like domain/WhiA C-terminal HTH domain